MPKQAGPSRKTIEKVVDIEILFAVDRDIYEGFNVLTAVVDVMLTVLVNGSVPLNSLPDLHIN